MYDVSEIVISEEAIRAAESIGVYGDVSAKLQRMLKFATPFTHVCGNLRYDRYVLDVQEGELVDVSLLSERESDRAPPPARVRERRAEPVGPRVMCSICDGEMVWTVTGVDDDGNEVPMTVPCPRAQDPNRLPCDQV